MTGVAPLPDDWCVLACLLQYASLPPLSNSDWCAAGPVSGQMVLLPLRPDNGYQAEVRACDYLSASLSACQSLCVYMCVCGWCTCVMCVGGLVYVCVCITQLERWNLVFLAPSSFLAHFKI